MPRKRVAKRPGGLAWKKGTGVPAIVRVWRFVNKTETCWLWTGFIDKPGYGHFRVGTKYAPCDGRPVKYVHRWLYETLRGPISPDLDLDHLCRVRHCVNPDHLEPVTHKENVLRGASFAAENAKQTHCKWGHPLPERGGKRRHCTPCTSESVRRFRRKCRQNGIRYWEPVHLRPKQP